MLSECMDIQMNTERGGKTMIDSETMLGIEIGAIILVTLVLIIIL